MWLEKPDVSNELAVPWSVQKVPDRVSGKVLLYGGAQDLRDPIVP